MNRSVGKTLALLASIMASLWASVAVAELSATVDRREIAMGETLRLTLLGDAGLGRLLQALASWRGALRFCRWCHEMCV